MLRLALELELELPPEDFLVVVPDLLVAPPFALEPPVSSLAPPILPSAPPSESEPPVLVALVFAELLLVAPPRFEGAVLFFVEELPPLPGVESLATVPPAEVLVVDGSSESHPTFNEAITPRASEKLARLVRFPSRSRTNELCWIDLHTSEPLYCMERPKELLSR